MCEKYKQGILKHQSKLVTLFFGVPLDKQKKKIGKSSSRIFYTQRYGLMDMRRDAFLQGCTFNIQGGPKKLTHFDPFMFGEIT